MAKKEAPKAEPPRIGRPPHVPTPLTKRTVVALASVGYNHLKIAAHLEIDTHTLRLRYRRELDHSTEIMCANALMRLVKASNAGTGMASVRASMAILGCRGGWRETSKLEIESTGRGVTAINAIISAARQAEADELLAAIEAEDEADHPQIH
jgi:hypothetical protein